jgi:hypothetical protein
MARIDWDDITIRETAEGPELVFDGGVHGWVLPVTDNDLARLSTAIHDREAKPKPADTSGTVHTWPAGQPVPEYDRLAAEFGDVPVPVASWFEHGQQR